MVFAIAAHSQKRGRRPCWQCAKVTQPSWALDLGRGVPEPAFSPPGPTLLIGLALGSPRDRGGVGSRLGGQWEPALVLGSQHCLLGHEGGMKVVLTLARPLLWLTGPVIKEHSARNRRLVPCGLSCSILDLYFSFLKQRSGEGLTHLSAFKDPACNPFPTPAQTCSEGKEADLVLVLPQKCHDPPPHPLVPLVDELVAEVAVDLLCRHLLVWREGGVDEAGQL